MPRPSIDSVYWLDPQQDFLKIQLAEQILWLISGLTEFLRKLQNSAENGADHHKFSWQARHSKYKHSSKEVKSFFDTVLGLIFYKKLLNAEKQTVRNYKNKNAD